MRVVSKVFSCTLRNMLKAASKVFPCITIGEQFVGCIQLQNVPMHVLLLGNMLRLASKVFPCISNGNMHMMRVHPMLQSISTPLAAYNSTINNK